MARSRVNKASINLVTTSVYEIVIFVCTLILPRLILSRFGSAYNGIVSSVTQFLSLVSILRLGVAGATRVALYKTLAAGDLAGTSAIVKATENHMRRIGCVILVYIAALAVLYPLFTNIDNIPGQFRIQITGADQALTYTVLSEEDGEMVASLQPDENGRAASPLLPCGSYRIRAGADGADLLSVEMVKEADNGAQGASMWDRGQDRGWVRVARIAEDAGADVSIVLTEGDYTTEKTEDAGGYTLHLTGEKISYWDIALLVVAAGIGTFAQYFFGITYETFLSADQSIYIYNISQAACTLANTLLSVLLIYAGCTIQTVKLACASVFFFTPFFLKFYVSRKYRLDTKCAPDNTALKNRKDVLASSLANIVHENTDIVVLTVFCDVKIVSVYTIYNLVMSALRRILNIFYLGTEAIFGDMWAKKQYDSIRNGLSVFEYVIGVFISVVFSATLTLIVPFVRLYTTGVTDVNYILPAYALVISIAMACYCFRTPYLTLVQGVGRYKETKRGAFFEAGLNLVSSVVLVQFIGITGTAVGTLLANIFRSFQYAFYIDDHLVPRGKRVVFRRVAWIALNIALSCALGRLLLGGMADGGWLSWCLCGAAMVGISAGITAVTSFLFCREDAKGTLQVAGRMIARRKGRA